MYSSMTGVRMLAALLSCLAMLASAFVDFDAVYEESGMDCLSGAVSCTQEQVEAAEEFSVSAMRTELMQREAQHVRAGESVQWTQDMNVPGDAMIDELSDGAIAGALARPNAKSSSYENEKAAAVQS
eukprot:TRINITY_DN10901_c0_g1_i1.p1 TRINITY_DN10901_c0_g1~~TRINITY_DN10901_c0_g1_i1.p1  ORF type:complete len:127 (-),score=38.49 TRINITY_DN10901_c0_g1_i1:49-429(-)